MNSAWHNEFNGRDDGEMECHALVSDCSILTQFSNGIFKFHLYVPLRKSCSYQACATVYHFNSSAKFHYNWRVIRESVANYTLN